MRQGAKDKPFEGAQDRPFDKAQDRPFDRLRTARGLVPIGLLLGRRMTRSWPLGRWPGLELRKVSASSGVAPDYVFRPTSRWLSAMVIWAVAMGRRQTQPTEAASPSPPFRTPKHPALGIGSEIEADPRAIQPFGLQRRPAPPTRTPHQIDLPRPGFNASLALRLGSGDVLSLSKGQALRWTLAVRPIASREPSTWGTTSTGLVSRAGGGGLEPRSGLAASPQPPRSRQTPDPAPSTELRTSPSTELRTRMQVSWRWPDRPFAQHAPGTQEPAVGTEADAESLTDAVSLPMARGPAGGRRAWIPLALHLPVRATPPQHGLVHRTPGVTVSEEGRAPDHSASPGRFRSTVAREVALLVKEVTRVVEERVRPSTEPPPPRTQPPPPAPKLDPAEVFRLAQREYQERAFRMGL